MTPTFLGLPVSKGQLWLAKDLFIVIYNKERKQYPDLYDFQYVEKLKAKLIKKYKQAKGSKTIIEILKEYRKELNKKEDN